MITDQQFNLDEIYESLQKIELLLGIRNVYLVLTGNGCGRLEHVEYGCLTSWSSLDQGRNRMFALVELIESGKAYTWLRPNS